MNPLNPCNPLSFLSYSAHQFRSRCFLHLDVGEEFLARILQAGPEEIDRVVDDEEAVVVVLADIHRDGRILLVVPLEVELLLLGERAGVDGCRDAGIALAEHGERRLVNIIIIEHDAAPGLPDETDDLGVGIEYLSVVEGRDHDTIECIGEGTALDGRQRGADEEVDLLLMMV